MRLSQKFKQFSKLTINFSGFPNKISKFHRTKWKFIQKFFLVSTNKKKSLKSFLWNVNPIIFTKRWIYYKKKYSFGVKLKKYFDCLFDKAFSSLFFKKLKLLNAKKEKTLEYCVYLIKPQFRIDFFLFRLCIFSSSYEARNFINNGKVLVNGNRAFVNYFIKKGDIISFNSINYHQKCLFNYFLKQKFVSNQYLSFIEVDYYTMTLICLKNYFEFSQTEMIFFGIPYLDIIKFKSFIE